MKFHFKSSIVLTIIFVLSVSAIFLIAGVTYKKLIEINKSTDLVLHTYDVSIQLENLISELGNHEIIERDYVLFGDNITKQQVQESREKILQLINEIKFVTTDNNIQQTNLLELKKIIAQKFTLSDTIYQLSFNKTEERKNEILRNLVAGMKLSLKFKVLTKKMIAHENELLINRTKKAKYELLSAPVILYSTLLVTLLFIVMAYIKITKDLSRQKKLNNKLEITSEIINMGETVGKYGNWQWNIAENSFYFSDSLYLLMGSKPGAFEPTAENYLKHLHPDDFQKVNAATERLFRDEIFPVITYRFVLPNNEVKYIRAEGKLVVNKSGEKVFVGSSLDITEEQIHYQELELRNQELESKNKELEEFNYVASHDLQEPLRKIQTFVSRIADSEDALQFSESTKNFFDRMNQAAGRMRTLIDDLLQYSKANKSEYVFEETNLNELIKNVLKELTPAIEDIKPIIEANELPTIKVIPFQIQQVFLNLLSNSLKYHNVNNTCRIAIKYSKISVEETSVEPITNNWFHSIEFKDNGIGFEQEYAEQIFLLFNRLHSKEEYSGTGIGLAICKKIIENHKGHIVAEGKPNIGSTFTIYLPIID